MDVAIIVVVVHAAGRGTWIRGRRNRAARAVVPKRGFEVHAKACAKAETVRALIEICAAHGERGDCGQGESGGKNNSIHILKRLMVARLKGVA